MDQVDFGIISAVGIERKIINSYGSSTAFSDDEGYIYHLIKVRNIRYNCDFTLIHYNIGDVGNVKAAVVAEKLIKFNPTYIIMIGIAGGIKSAGVKIGDIVISNQIHYYSSNTIRNGREHIRPEGHPADPHLLNNLKDFSDTNEWLKDLIDLENFKKEFNHIPEVHFGDFLTGESVVKDETFQKKLLKKYPKAIAFEMESWGVIISSLFSKNQPRFVSIRGVSDLSNNLKNDRYQNIAMNFAFMFLLSFLNNTLIKPITNKDFSLYDKIIARGLRKDIAKTILSLDYLKVEDPQEIIINDKKISVDLTIRKMDGTIIALIIYNNGSQADLKFRGSLNVLNRVKEDEMDNYLIIILSNKKNNSLKFKNSGIKIVDIPNNADRTEILSLLRIGGNNDNESNS